MQHAADRIVMELGDQIALHFFLQLLIGFELCVQKAGY